MGKITLLWLLCITSNRDCFIGLIRLGDNRFYLKPMLVYKIFKL